MKLMHFHIMSVIDDFAVSKCTWWCMFLKQLKQDGSLNVSAMWPPTIRIECTALPAKSDSDGVFVYNC